MPDLIRIELPRCCFLLLTVEEYRRALGRGKGQRRREQLEQRMGRREAKQARQAELEAARGVRVE